MKALLGIFLTLGLIFASLPAAAAQDNEAPTLPGFGDAVAWTDESGNTIASATVNDVQNDFRDYGQGYGPEYGYAYTLVDISVVNSSDSAIILEAHTFVLVDDQGRGYNRLNFSGAGVETFNDDLPLAPGESAELTLGYSIPAHLNATMFAWSPGTEQIHYVVLTTVVNENSAIAWGVETPSVFTDEFGNVVASFQITDINEDWTDYSDFYEPEDGGRYMTVNIAITNETDRPVDIERYDFTMMFADGRDTSAASVKVKDGVEQEPFRERIALQPGESTEVMIAFELTSEQVPAGVVWSPDYSITNIVFFASPPAAPTETDPTEATPEAN